MPPRTEGYSQLEQPLFLRMASGVVPKTNLTFCSTPWGQRTHVTCRAVGGGRWGEMGGGDGLCQEKHTIEVLEV